MQTAQWSRLTQQKIPWSESKEKLPIWDGWRTEPWKWLRKLKQRDWRNLHVSFGKLFLEIHNNVEEKGCSISSGAVTVKLIPRSSLCNYCIRLSDPTQALEFKSCSYEDQAFMTQKSPFGEKSYRLEEGLGMHYLISEKSIHGMITVW